MTPQVGDIVIYAGKGYSAIWVARRDSGQRYVVVNEQNGIDAEGDVWVETAPDAFIVVGIGTMIRFSLQEVIDRFGLAAARR